MPTLLLMASGVLGEYDRPDAPSVSVLVIKDGRTALKRSYGLADLESKTKATPATNYRLASVSKQFTAAAVLSLIDDGKLELTTPLAQLIPGLPAGITVHHLLTHHSGLADYEDHMPPGTHQVLDADVIAILRGVPKLLAEPGAKYAYSNSGYAVLAQIVEKVSGEKYEDYLQRRILRRAGMKHSVAHREGKDTVARRAYGYSPDGGAWKRTDQSRTSAVLGDGGVYSSIDDLEHWIGAITAQRVLKPATHEAAWRVQAGPYGFGYFVKPERIWHTGETIGFRNAMLFDRARNVTVVVLSNRNNLKALELAERLASEF